MKYRKITLILGAIAAFLLFVGNHSTQAKYINKTTIPNELRGTWYSYEGDNTWEKLRFKKHSFKPSYYKYSLTPNKRGVKKLIVENKNAKNAYSLNKPTSPFNNAGNYWLSNKKINGKKTLINLAVADQYKVFTRTKIKHDYTFAYINDNYYEFIGTKGNSKHFVGTKGKYIG